MSNIRLVQIGIIIFSVLVKNLIFQHYGWDYDVFTDGFDLVKIISNIGALIGIVFLVSFVISKLRR